jgi:hypothetical protein
VSPFIVLALFWASDLWVFEDARKRHQLGTPVVWAGGPLRLETPVVWLIACLLLWIVFFPLYLFSRRSSP